jgi:uncharacterized membrane protein YiaA
VVQLLGAGQSDWEKGFLYSDMDIVKKLIAGVGLGCLLAGTVIALVGLYLKGLELAIIGFVFIAVGIVIMELLHRKI